MAVGWTSTKYGKRTVALTTIPFPPAFTNFVLDKPQPYPIVLLGMKTIQLPQNAPASSDADANEWMRWNNYGIALLGQLQYSQAVDAFEHVIKLRPDYADGYTNIAL